MRRTIRIIHQQQLSHAKLSSRVYLMRHTSSFTLFTTSVLAVPPTSLSYQLSTAYYAPRYSLIFAASQLP